MFSGSQMTWESDRVLAVKHLSSTGSLIGVYLTVKSNTPNTIRGFSAAESVCRRHLEEQLDEMEEGIKEAREWLSQHC